MSEITIKFALENFNYGFTWEGDEAEGVGLITQMRQLAQCHGFDPMVWLTSCVVHAPTSLTAIENREVMMAGIVGYLLQQPTHQPEYPGLIGDYLAVYDFEITITSISNGMIRLGVIARAIGEGAGTA